MRQASWIKETKREFVREKRRRVREIQKNLDSLRIGCLMLNDCKFGRQVGCIQVAVNEITAILKPF